MKSTRVVVGFIISAIMGVFVIATPAEAAIPLGYHALIPDTVSNGANCDENSNSLKGCEHAQAIVDAIKGVPCSSNESIRVPVFNMNLQVYADALVDKAECGVNLYLLTWHGKDEDGSMVSPSSQVLQIRDAIVKAKRGKYKDCRNSCYSTSKKDSLHTKEFLFSHTGGRANVVIVDENNATIGGDSRMFGSWTTLSDSCLYSGMVKWFDKGFADKKRNAPGAIKSCDKKQIVYYTPSKKNPAVDQLKAVKIQNGCRAELDVFQVTLNAPVNEMIRLTKGKLIKQGKKKILTKCRTRAIVDWTKIASGLDPSGAQMKQIRRLVSNGIETRDSSWKLPTYNHRKQTITNNSVSVGATNQTTASFKSANILMVNYNPSDVAAAWKASDQMASYSHILSVADVGCVGKKQPSGCK